MHTTHFCNNLHQVMLKAKILENQIILKSLGARKPKGLNRIARIGYSHLCLREGVSSSICHGWNIDVNCLYMCKSNFYIYNHGHWDPTTPHGEKVSFKCSCNEVFCVVQFWICSRHNIAELLLKLAWNTNQSINQFYRIQKKRISTL